MEGNAELLALQRLDETSSQLQKQGSYLEALECMERGLVLRQHFFGAESDEVWTACKTVGEMCNLLAMTYLQQEDFNMVLELLKKAEVLTERDPGGRAATFNNLACYYRRQGKLHAALQYLQKALKIEARLPDVQNPADTHINACAVLSQLGRHQTALEHAQQALILLQEELLSPPGSSEAAAPPQADRIAVLSIAYHNIGVEQEFLKRYDQSMLSYRKGAEVAERYLGAKHAICITLKNSVSAAKKSAAVAASKSVKQAAAVTLRNVRNNGLNSSKNSTMKSFSGSTSGIKKLKEMARAAGPPNDNYQNNNENENEEGNADYGMSTQIRINSPTEITNGLDMSNFNFDTPAYLAPPPKK